MTGAVGKEWNVTSAVKNMTRPDVITRAGKMIQPISKRAKAQRPAAKF
jgi:U3 small nucleolar RNA-associated protein 14